MPLELQVAEIIKRYSESFSNKTYNDENDDVDLLMELFAISPELKRENRQYWGRELGMVWQLVVTEVFRDRLADFGPALKVGDDEPADFTAGRDAVDTKYRIGSGDAGTLKKLKQYGKLLAGKGYRPVMLILREDNLKAAITACHAGGWTVLTGAATFSYIQQSTGVDLRSLLKTYGTGFHIKR